MIDPIRPDQIADGKASQMPDIVIETFNILIAQNFANGRATVKQADIVAALLGRGFERQRIFDNHWLDVEPMYEAAGWKVEYEKPGYNESGSAFFTFTKAGKNA